MMYQAVGEPTLMEIKIALESPICGLKFGFEVSALT